MDKKQNSSSLQHIRKTQKDLKESEVFYKHLVDLAPEAVVIHSEGRIVFVNPAAQRLIEIKDPKEIIGKPVMDYVHPDSVPLIRARIKKMLLKKKVAPFAEEKFINAKGKVLIAETKAVPFIFQGKPSIVAILHDITERKKAEERQKYLNEISVLLGRSIDYRITLKNINKILVPALADYIRIVVLDDTNQVTEIAEHHVNPHKLRLVKELYNSYKGMTDATHGVGHMLSTGKSEILERVTPEVIGEYKELEEIIHGLGLVSYMGVPLKARGKVIGAITFSSIRQDRIYSKEDLRFADTVARHISYAIDNSLLFQKAQQLIKLQDEFISMASHELKTPITSMKMFLDILQKKIQPYNDQVAEKVIQRIMDQTDKLRDLTANLLDVTRMENGKLRLTVEKFIINELLEDTIEGMRPAIKNHKVTFLDGKKLLVSGDRFRLYQVITNLLNNAVKYSPRGKEVIVSLKKSGTYAVISVKDFGIGIEKNKQRKVFEKLYQVNDSTENTFPGLGIGLYISKEIIERHKGDIWVESTKGKGSTFFFSLPLHN